MYPSSRNQSTDFHSKLIQRLLYDRNMEKYGNIIEAILRISNIKVQL